jgi:hypothetical protein
VLASLLLYHGSGSQCLVEEHHMTGLSVVKTFLQLVRLELGIWRSHLSCIYAVY